MTDKNPALQILDRINFSSNVGWILLDLNESDGTALVVAEKCVAKMPFNTKWEKITWEECTLRTWLNDTFYNDLSDMEKEHIIYVKNENKDSCTIPGGNDTFDHVFLLTTEQYNNMPDEYKQARFEGSLCWWWLRTPGYDSYNFANVNRRGGLDGGLDANGRYVGHGYHVDSDSGSVRPACYMKLN